MSQERHSKGNMLKDKPKTSCLWKKFSRKQSSLDQTGEAGLSEHTKYFDKPIENTNPDRQTDNGYEHEIHGKELYKWPVGIGRAPLLVVMICVKI